MINKKTKKIESGSGEGGGGGGGWNGKSLQ
jgi:hypothetical protein